MGGRNANEYGAIVEGLTVASGRTLRDLHAELAEWIEEERQMEHQAIWLCPQRSGRYIP